MNASSNNTLVAIRESSTAQSHVQTRDLGIATGCESNGFKLTKIGKKNRRVYDEYDDLISTGCSRKLNIKFSTYYTQLQ